MELIKTHLGDCPIANAVLGWSARCFCRRDDSNGRWRKLDRGRGLYFQMDCSMSCVISLGYNMDLHDQRVLANDCLGTRLRHTQALLR